MPAAAVAVTALLMHAGARADAAADIDRLLRGGDTAAALAQVDQALVHQPRDARLRFLRGVALADMKRDGEAMLAYRALIEDHPELPEPYNNLAVLQAAQGDFEQARASLEAALRSRPGHVTALENLGDVHLELAARAWARAAQAARDEGGTSRVAGRLARLRALQDDRSVAGLPAPAQR